jgi:hypothetical protein
MKTKSETIKKVLTFLNNPNENGGLWLPNIQRYFVWDEDQITKLFDSIMRRYPINTMLIWVTKESIRTRPFIAQWRDSQLTHISRTYRPEDDSRKCIVLDGQQRLQSLFIGLHGSFEEKELYLNILSGSEGAPEEIKFEFKFLRPTKAKLPWIKLKDLVFSPLTSFQLRRTYVSDLTNTGKYSDHELYKAEENVSLVKDVFATEEVITYQEMDSIEYSNLYTTEDVVEIFIRANSGGTPLEKSDLLFSLLNSNWGQADSHIEELLLDINRNGYNFDRDFVLKTCLVLLNKKAKYQVEKFRDPEIQEQIGQGWSQIANSIRAVVDHIYTKTYIRCGKALPSALALIPLIYVRHHYPAEWGKSQQVEHFLIRALLAGAFSGQSDRVLDALVSRFQKLKGFDAEQAFSVIRDQNRALEITPEKFFGLGYGSRTIHLIFNLWYKNLNYEPLYENNLPQVDHIFPVSLLGKSGAYPKSEINQLANCMLLTRHENGPAQKTNTPPEEWFENKPGDYLDLHLIPRDRKLWKLENFRDFTDARKKLIAEKFDWLINRNF